MSRRAFRRRGFVLGLAATLACQRKRAPSDGPPQRIVSQVVDADEILWELGEDVRARVVGISSMADDPRYATAPGRWPQVVPRVAGSSETLLAARPDLVVVAEFSSAEVRALLQSSGIRTLVLSGFDGFDHYRARVRAIAGAVEAAQKGETLVQRFDAGLDEIRVRPAGPRLRALSWVRGNVAGANTTFDDVATAAGLENLAATQGLRGHQAVPLEQAVAWNPQVLVTQCGSEDCAAERARLEAAPGWSATAAARGGNVVPVPSRLLFAAGWGMLDTVAWIVDATGGR